MVVVWSEQLLHSGVKSREMGDNDILHKEDKRFFAYAWPSVAGQSKSRSKGKINS